MEKYFSNNFEILKGSISESLSKVQKAILKKILEDPQYAKKILSEESSDEILSEFSNESYDPTFGGPFAQDPYDF